MRFCEGGFQFLNPLRERLEFAIYDINVGWNLTNDTVTSTTVRRDESPLRADTCTSSPFTLLAWRFAVTPNLEW